MAEDCLRVWPDLQTCNELLDPSETISQEDFLFGNIFCLVADGVECVDCSLLDSLTFRKLPVTYLYHLFKKLDLIANPSRYRDLTILDQGAVLYFISEPLDENRREGLHHINQVIQFDSLAYLEASQSYLNRQAVVDGNLGAHGETLNTFYKNGWHWTFCFV